MRRKITQQELVKALPRGFKLVRFGYIKPGDLWFHRELELYRIFSTAEARSGRSIDFYHGVARLSRCVTPAGSAALDHEIKDNNQLMIDHVLQILGYPLS